MDQLRPIDTKYLLQHRHKDGSWAGMSEVASPHDPGAHDGERSWGRRRFFRCNSCEESATVLSDQGDQEGEPR